MSVPLSATIRPYVFHRLQFKNRPVSPRYIRSLRDAGLENLTAHDVIRLHAMGSRRTS